MTKTASSTMLTTQVDATMMDGERVSPTERCTAEPVLYTMEKTIAPK